ncbi:uncharacterized protein [Nicotiana tomentosiformis]|uniref:uncharacterized protein n=1 Tax=Nicotiana tomentosiformis TaxID=4098 RepID=UPI00388C47F0
MVDNYKQWDEKLPFALLRYRTTVRTSTGATPYLLVYGTEAVIPAEVEIPSLKIIQEAELSHEEWVQSFYEQLALIDGKRLNAVCHSQLYQNRMARAFNKKKLTERFGQNLSTQTQSRDTIFRIVYISSFDITELHLT